MYRRFTAVFMGVLVAGAVAVSAQQSATITLASGEKLSGELVDLGGSGFTVRVNGQDRQIGRGDVHLISFGGDTAVPDAARNLPTGSVVAVLNNGETIQGEFYDIGGTRPLNLTFRTASGERVVNSDQVRAIYLTRVTEGSAGGGQSAPQRTVTVSSRAWTPTGITVRRGQTVRFDANGEVTFSPQNHVATPAGSRDNLFDSRAPVPTLLQGALIGRVGASGRGGGSVFAIGGQNTVVMPADGQLFLGVNDSGLGDNRGDFSVGITPQ
jgi:hypothetical protein